MLRPLFVLAILAGPAALALERIDFEAAETGALPPGWREVQPESGMGRNWVVLTHLHATSGANVFAKIAVLAEAGEAPMAIRAGPPARDGELKVQAKPMGGIGPQRAGLVFRYRDPANYSVVSADLQTGEISAERIEAGARIALGTAPAGAFTPNAAGWTALQASFRGTRIEVFVNGRKCLEAIDSHEGRPGQVGLRAAAGALVFFDDFENTSLNGPTADPR